MQKVPRSLSNYSSQKALRKQVTDRCCQPTQTIRTETDNGLIQQKAASDIHVLFQFCTVSSSLGIFTADPMHVSLAESPIEISGIFRQNPKHLHPTQKLSSPSLECIDTCINYQWIFWSLDLPTFLQPISMSPFPLFLISLFQSISFWELSHVHLKFCKAMLLSVCLLPCNFTSSIGTTTKNNWR